VHIRREPPAYQASRAARASRADAFMAETAAAVSEPCRQVFEDAEELDLARGPQCIIHRTAALARVSQGAALLPCSRSFRLLCMCWLPQLVHKHDGKARPCGQTSHKRVLVKVALQPARHCT
jgi:hypothetical protein